MRRNSTVPLACALAALLLTLTGPALAAPTVLAVPADKPLVLDGWTRTGAASHDAWAAARADRAAWTAYAFDWSTDHCTTSPDNPFGFPFRTACARHDFGYRNHKAAGSFRAAKRRLDDAFHADLVRVCARYASVRKASCHGTARTYYEAVRTLGIPLRRDGRST
ncbi:MULTISPECIES: phospholipase [unclassified Streptomyces]|uniref:phospholipase n=1 Tax=unclassified Streptomyces TaxID=2593676 RepID=UPI0029ADF278|nr:phospholipase [Streptomyces sp. DK15]MDX2396327.1 phospholipase [Streptomyces sp. DK15]